MSMTEALAPHLPYLRRYARVLTGSQTSGDAYVRAALTAILAGKSELGTDLPPRVALYRLFHAIWSTSSGRLESEQDMAPQVGASPDANPDDRLRSLSAADRAALLLTAVEGFSINEAAKILGDTPQAVEQLIVDAQNHIESQLASKVLIIEDESIIALDLENLVTDLGHEVCAIASSRDDAVNKARMHKPGLILADINLGEGGSGIDAVTEILRGFDVPVIFITAYPERLLTGERPEPTYLITKPFLPETVQATIGQALFFHSQKKQAA